MPCTGNCEGYMLYLFDGSKEGFLTALTRAFQEEESFVTSKRVQLCLGQGQVCVKTDVDLAKRVAVRLRSFDKRSTDDLDLLLRSGEEDNEQIAFRYFRLLAQEKVPVRGRLSHLDVFRAVECIQKVSAEIHRFHGFIRFMETASGALYAPFSPDNDIVDLLLPHFRARLPQFAFVLHDVKRQKAAVYDGNPPFSLPFLRRTCFLRRTKRVGRDFGANTIKPWIFPPVGGSSKCAGICPPVIGVF